MPGRTLQAMEVATIVVKKYQWNPIRKTQMHALLIAVQATQCPSEDPICFLLAISASALPMTALSRLAFSFPCLALI